MDTKIDNQQETVSNTELSWLAGILDGEGSIGLNRMSSHRKNHVITARVSVGNTNPLIIIHVCKILDKLPVTGHIQKRQKGGKGENKNWKEAWIVQISNINGVKNILESTLPFLIGKKANAELVLRFIYSRLREYQKNNGIKSGSSYTEEELSLYEQSKQLNLKGIRQDPQRLDANPHN